jgi:PKD repeat protein
VGDTIQFTDASFHGPTNWAWDFGDGTQISGGDEEAQHPVHSYDEPGMYNVTLTISNAVEEISSTEQGFIQVLPTNAIDLPFADDFETSELDTETWFVRDVALDGDTWELTNNASVSGTQGMFISNWADGVMYGRDQLISSTMDLSGMDEVHISYKWSFCFKGNEETDDRLKVYASTDCGKTWSLRRMHRGFTDLPSAPPHSFNFTPDGEDEWAEYTLVLPYEQFMVENFRLMFEFESRLGNNLYFDDVNIVAYGAADVLEMEAATGVVPELYPNPTSGQTGLRFNLRTSRSVAVSVKDASGRLLKETRYGRLEAGEHVLSLDLRGWPRGLYFIEIKADAARRTSRLILAGIG